MKRRHLRQSQLGASLLEMVVVVGVVSLFSVVSVPLLTQAEADARTQSAARYLATQVQSARLEAVRRGAHVAIRFEDGHRFTTYVDGNGNGVRTVDIARNIDVPIGPSDALGDHFGDADLRIAFAAPGIEAGPAVASGSDPVRLGSGTLLSWSPIGSSTSGTLYVAGPRGPQWAVRIFGATGRVRVLRFDPGANQWRSH